MLLMVVRTIIVYVFVLFIMRFMGKRQLGELQASELVSTMIISNLASVSIEQQSIPILVGIIPVVLIASLEIIISGVTVKNARFERFIEGQPKIVLYNGRFVQPTLSLLRFTVTEVLCALRDKDIFDPSAVSLAFIEPNGNLSAYSMEHGPKSPNDPPPATVIVEGIIIEDALKICKKSEDWLFGYLKASSLKVQDVMLMLVYNNDRVRIEEYDQKNHQKRGSGDETNKLCINISGFYIIDSWIFTILYL